MALSLLEARQTWSKKPRLRWLGSQARWRRLRQVQAAEGSVHRIALAPSVLHEGWSGAPESGVSICPVWGLSSTHRGHQLNLRPEFQMSLLSGLIQCSLDARPWLNSAEKVGMKE